VITKKAVQDEGCKKKLDKLLKKLWIEPWDISLYILSFIHRSIVNERSDYTPEHNERLEFLGDAVLELTITDFLFREFPEKQEWELTDLRSAIVRGRNLSGIAKKLNFDEYLFLGKGEEQSGGRENDYILANTLEAFIGALYIDKGLEEATSFIRARIYSTLPDIIRNKLFKDYKTLIQELAQAEHDITPTYQVLNEEGPDHNKNFKVWVFLEDKCVGEGEGTSKKKAQEKAAENGYNTLISWKK